MLDVYLQRFQNLPSFTVYSIDATGEQAAPWLTIEGEAIAKQLIFDELNPKPQIDTIAADLQKWIRIEAHARRAWALTERKLRSFEASVMLAMLESGDKKPTVAHMEAKYRSHPHYAILNAEIERAEESYNAVRGVVEGMRAKRDVILRFARKPLDA